MESATIIETAPMEIEQAKRLVGVQNPGDLEHLSREYAHKIWAMVENEEWNAQSMFAISLAYRRISQSICEKQIVEVGRFTPAADFSVLSDVEVFPGRLGVETCSACNGLGERMKFVKKPAEVQCLKCKTVSYILDGQMISIDEDTIVVNDEDKSDDPKYKWLLGRVVEDCLSCKGTGYYSNDFNMKDLRVKVKCKTCRGRKYTPDVEKTQVLTKCKTCKGKRTLKIPKLTGTVKSTTTCKICKGLGFVRPKPAPDNPVLSPDIANAIKKL